MTAHQRLHQLRSLLERFGTQRLFSTATALQVDLFTDYTVAASGKTGSRKNIHASGVLVRTGGKIDQPRFARDRRQNLRTGSLTVKNIGWAYALASRSSLSMTCLIWHAAVRPLLA